MSIAPFFAAAFVLVSLHEGQVAYANRPSIDIQETLDVEFNGQGSQGESMGDETTDGLLPRQGAIHHVNPPAELPQELLAGTWAVGKRLGAGISGAAYEYTVTCGEVACPVAVKQSKDQSGHVNAVRIEGERLLQVQKSSKPSHYVAKLIPPGSFPCDKNKKIKHCLAMEFFNKGELQSLVPNLDDENKAMYFWQLTKGVKDIHDQGLVHMDIKLDNALVNCEEGACYAAVIDMGLARRMHEVLERGTGTPGYMAPEVSQGAACTGSMDVWSLGVLMQYLFTGEMPTFFVQGKATATNIGNARRLQLQLAENHGKEDPHLKELTDSGKPVKKKVVEILEKIYTPSTGREAVKSVLPFRSSPALPARITIEQLLEEAEGLLRLAAPDAERVLTKTPEQYGARKPLPKCLLDARWAPAQGA